MFADVLIEYPSKKIDKTFTYIIPYRLEEKLKIGMHVKVTFNNRVINGFVMDIKDEYYIEYDLKEIIDIVDEEIIMNDELLNIGSYMHEKTLCPKIVAFQTMLPSSLKIKDKKHNYESYDTYLVLNKDIMVIDEYIEVNKRSTKQIEILESIIENKKVLKNKFGYSSVKALIDKGLIREEKELKYRINKDSDNKSIKHKLNEEQLNCFNEVKENINKYNTFLLEGVTGSGKTEVYLNLINEVINNGKTAIMLVPEISLTMQIVNRFYDWFGSRVAIFHSALSDGEKYDEYMKVVRGEVDVVVGTRSAIFTPLKNIGIIIIDECHSDTYKQDTTPRYNALDIAEFRCKYHKCPLILGSATPTLEIRARAIKGVYKYLKLTKRVGSSILPVVKLVDMTKEIKKGNYIVSEELVSKINEKLIKNEQIIILLNRRGYSTTISCSNCGFTFKCPHCDITLTYHKTTKNLICHYCGFTLHAPEFCPECHEDGLSYLGLGTEKLESEINKLFPDAKVVRMDQDSTTKKGSHERIINEFRNHEYDILIGTQMISKGLDFPLVTLVGIVSADNSLNIPDFRSNERTFSLLTQVSGRAGRSENKGEVILQTYNPDNFILECVKENDFDKFYQEEMNIRRTLKYPPYYYLVGMKVVSSDYKCASMEACKIVKYLKNNIDNSSIVLGPTTHNLFKFKNNYRFVIVIKYRFDTKLFKVLKDIDELYLFNKDVKIEVDIDPLHI